jgi:twitching motility two-component system response regulator PilG
VILSDDYKLNIRSLLVSQEKPSQETFNQEKLTLDQLSKVKVMVIDDSNTIRRSAEIFLKASGCQVILAEDGFDALAKISNEHPDLIFVDIMMPRLDGYQTCSLIKRNVRYKTTPVIMLSSKDGLFDRARGRMVGSDQYLTKPFTQKTLLDAVQIYAAYSKANQQEAE